SPNSNIWRTLSVSTNTWKAKRMPTLSTLFNATPKVIRTVKQENEIKWIQTGNEETKISYYASHMILSLKVPMDSTRKLFD
ncbi:hypothetical protein ACQP3J_33405, partial [Escherichia coli]